MAEDEKKTISDLYEEAAADPTGKHGIIIETTASQTTEKEKQVCIEDIEESLKQAKEILKQFVDEAGLDQKLCAAAIEKTSIELAKLRPNITPDINARAMELKTVLDTFVDRIKELYEPIKEWAAMQPYIEAELKKPEYGGKTFAEIEREGSADTEENNGIIPGSTLDKLFKAAFDAMEADKGRQGLPTAAIKRADIIEYPLDKINSNVWQLLQEDTGGQVTFKAEKTGSKKQLNIYYSINFEDLTNINGVTITKQLLPFDERVYIAVAALFNAGNNIITLTQIHYAMGNSKRPNAKQLQKIYDSVKKMTTARISVDTAEEAAVYKGYAVFKYSGSLMPVEDIQAIVNGQLSDAAIHLFREPPLITFAKERKQVTTISVSLLDSPVSKTDANLAIDNYLIERIARAQKSRQPAKILYKTLYEKAGITTVKQKQRTPEKVKRYLDHYRQQQFICDYTMEADGITVYFADKSKC